MTMSHSRPAQQQQQVLQMNGGRLLVDAADLRGRSLVDAADLGSSGPRTTFSQQPFRRSASLTRKPVSSSDRL